MGLLQWACATYDANQALVGKTREADREPLTPVAHTIQNAQIEITLDADGHFQSAKKVDKAKARTIIPVTIRSAGRSGTKAAEYVHPLCEQLGCFLDRSSVPFKNYINQLSAWVDAAPHPKTAAVLAYLRGGTLVQDLVAADILEQEPDGTLKKGAVEGTAYAKCLVRWRVESDSLMAPTACWEDSSLFENYTNYYLSRLEGAPELCLITGELGVLTENHPKGTIAISSGAKLISANDSSGFTYRGRFANAGQSWGVSYISSQKAHNALRWLAANHGTQLGGRTFLCWNPHGWEMPTYGFMGFAAQTATVDPVSYRQQLYNTLTGWGQQLPAEEDVVITALDAATVGRLSITYYNVLRGSDFLARMKSWYESCCWYLPTKAGLDIRSPTVKDLICCAFGTQPRDFITADERVLKEYAQRLLHCIADGKPLPADLVHALAQRASTPLAYKPYNRFFILCLACAAIRKYHNDQLKREEWTMALDKNCPDRSYLFGRLLAVAEQVEHSTYVAGEDRDTNATKMQAVFCQRPMYAWNSLETKLAPYYAWLARRRPGSYRFYKDLVGEIVEKLSQGDPQMLDTKLGDTYLLGYYLQRAELRNRSQKKEAVEEENNNERAE